MGELQPCPFCGADGAGYDNSQGPSCVYCPRCGAQGPDKNDDEQAAEAWNTRSPVCEDANSDALLDRIERCLENPRLRPSQADVRALLARARRFGCEDARAQAFEEAMKAAREHDPDERSREYIEGRHDAALAIRALSKTPPREDAREELVEALKPFAETARSFEFAIGPDGIDDGLSVMCRAVARPEYEARLSTADFSRAKAALAKSLPSLQGVMK